MSGGFIPDPQLVAARLRQGAELFRFRDAAGARAAMEGGLADDGVIGENRGDFADAVERRLRLLTQLNRRREFIRAAVCKADPGRDPQSCLSLA